MHCMHRSEPVFILLHNFIVCVYTSFITGITSKTIKLSPTHELVINYNAYTMNPSSGRIQPQFNITVVDHFDKPSK